MSFLLIAGFVFFPLPARVYADLPTDYSVESGAVTDEHTEHNLHLHIESDQAILNFRKFGIEPNESVTFHTHPVLTESSRTLARVTGGDVSNIAGRLTANAPLFLVNPAGIQVADTAVIDAQRGLVLSTLDIANEDFLSGNFRFEQVDGRLPASILNQGRILTRPGEIVALLGGSVRNDGLLLAELGSVTLAAGKQVTLSFDKDGWLGVAVDAPLTQVALGVDGKPVASAIEQSGQVLAPGGYVLVHARAVEGLFNRLVNLPAGVIEAVSVVARAGRVELVGEGGLLANGGRVSADGTTEAPDAGRVLVNATRILQEGLVTANAAEGGKAGEISVTGRDETVLAAGSRLEAKAVGQSGQGGSVWVRSSQPKLSGAVRFLDGSVIDVSGGSAAGDAGNVELSAQTVQFDGSAYAVAQDGYWGGLLMVDPEFLIFNTTANPSPPDNATGTPDLAHSDPPVPGTTTIEVADIVGFAQAFFQAVLDITINAALVMNGGNSLRLEAGRDILQNANVRVSSTGTLRMTADADFSGSGGAASDGVGTIVQAVGTKIESDKGSLRLSTGGDFTVRSVKGSGPVRVTSTAGNILDDGDSSTLVQAGSLFLTASAAGMGVGTTATPLDVDLDGDLTLTVGSAGAHVHDQASSFTLVSSVVASGGSLDVRADKTLNVEGAHAVTGGGTISLTGDADGDGDGAVKMKSGSSLSSDTGDVTVTNGGEMELETITSASGDILASSKDNIHVRGAVSTGGAGTITMIADSDSNGNGNFKMDGGSSLLTDTGDIGVTASERIVFETVTSTSGDISALSAENVQIRGAVSTGGAGGITMDADTDADGKGALTMDSGSSLATSAGDIELRSAGEMKLQSVTSATGDICAHSDDDIDVRAPMSTGGAGKITLWADADGSGKGTVKQDSSSDDITTDSGQILLWGAQGTKIRDLTSTSGNIFVWLTNADANMELKGLVSTGGSVELFAGGDIRDGNAADLNVSAGGDAEFTALNGTIGSAGNPLDVLIGGVLDVGAGGVEGGISVSLAGAVGGGVGGPPPTPPHLVTALGFSAAGPVPPSEVRLNGVNVAPLGGALGAGFDADTICITGPPPGGGGGGGPILILPISGPAALLDFIFEVENRRRYRGVVI